MSTLHEIDGDLVRTLSALFSALDVDHDTTRLRRSVETHPEFPRLVCVLETLDAYGLEAFVQEASLADLDALHGFALAHVRQGSRAGLVPIVRRDVQTIGVRLGPSGWTSMRREDFVSIWSGVLVEIEPTHDAGELLPVSESGHRHPSAVAGLVLAAFALAWGVAPPVAGWGWLLVGSALTSILGLLATLPLLATHLGASGTLARFCPTRGRSSCAAVVGSRFGSVRGVPVADLAALWFATRLSVLGAAWILGAHTVLAQAHVWLSVLALPVVAGALVVQWRWIGRWCRLCLVVQAALVLDALVAVLAAPMWSVPASSHAPMLVALLAALIATVWVLVRPVLKDALATERAENALVRQLRMPAFVRAAMGSAPPLPGLHGVPVLTLGDADAPLHVTIVAKLQCAACSAAVLELDRLVRMHPEDVRAQIVLLPGEPAVAGVLASILTLRALGPGNGALASLRAWYRDPRPRAHGGHRACTDSVTADIARLARWADDARVMGTPTIAIDGRTLPLGSSIDAVRAILFDDEREAPAPVRARASG